jgi:hypothetical protein
VHPNMVLVHDPSQESSSIDLLEVGGWVEDLGPGPFFFPGWIAFQNFLLASGGKKFEEKKKVESELSEMGPGLRALATQPFSLAFY